MVNRREQLRFGLAARPAFPHGPFLRAHVLQADGLHLGEAPVDGVLRGGSAGDAGADFVAEFGEVLEAWESMAPSPAILTRAGRVPSCSGPLGLAASLA